MDPAARQAIWQRIQSMARSRPGFEMKPPELLTNSRLSLEAAEFAKEAGVGEAFEERVYRAYFYEGLNIGNQSVLADLAADAGLLRDDLNLCPRFRALLAAAQEQRYGRAPEWGVRRSAHISLSANIHWSARRAKTLCARCSSAWSSRLSAAQ